MVDWIWENDGWDQFTGFAGEMGNASLDPLQAYVPGVDVIIDTVEWVDNQSAENAIDIFVPEEFEGVVGVAGDYGPGGDNNTSYIFPDPPSPVAPTPNPNPTPPVTAPNPNPTPPVTAPNPNPTPPVTAPPVVSTVVHPGCCCCCCCN